MKSSSILALPYLALWAAAGIQNVSASPAQAVQLDARNDCGAGGAAYTRRTNSPCGAGNGRHLYCGCDQTGVVQCLRGKWTEVQKCVGGTFHGCTANGSGAHCITYLG
ncbi:hypothetical protein FSARC_255 [Fusarium sarcochroum]|uniref:Bubble protein n=1 Tax=Fusarium sarcochroum TaxID=1208366 RepID=A0A8H4XGC5_9HYPO|nr:hypothetical protein FSARC_255 [Fusarium sarcochroum]